MGESNSSSGESSKKSCSCSLPVGDRIDPPQPLSWCYKKNSGILRVLNWLSLLNLSLAVRDLSLGHLFMGDRRVHVGNINKF